MIEFEKCLKVVGDGTRGGGDDGLCGVVVGAVAVEVGLPTSLLLLHIQKKYHYFAYFASAAAVKTIIITELLPYLKICFIPAGVHRESCDSGNSLLILRTVGSAFSSLWSGSSGKSLMKKLLCLEEVISQNKCSSD